MGYTLFVIGMLIAVFSDKTLAAVGTDCSSTACDAATEFCDAGTSTCACNAISTDNSGTCTLTDCTGDGSGGFECGSVANTACDGNNKCMCAATHTLSTTDSTCVSKGVSGSCEVDGGCVAVTYAVCTCMCMAGNTCLGDSCSANGDCVAVTNAVCTASACACPATHVTGTNTCTAKVIGDPCSAVGDCSYANSACPSTTCDCATEYTAIGGACLKGLGDSCSADGDCVAVTDAVCTSLACACPATHVTGTNTCTAKVLTDACTAGEGHCAGIGNAFCILSTCQCGPLFHSDPCVEKDCSGSPPECSGVSNSVCDDNSKCSCAATYQMSTTTGECVPKIIGDQCTVDGGECDDITNAECDTVASPAACKCSDGYTANNGACVVANNGSGHLLVSTFLVMIGAIATLIVN